MDPKSGRPLVEIDNPLNAEIRNSALTSYFGDVKEFMGNGAGGGSMSEERMQLERERLAQRKSEEEGRNARAGSKNDAATARLAASVAKNMGDIKRGLRLNNEQTALFQASLTKILSDAFSGGGGNGGDENPTEQPKKERTVTSRRRAKSSKDGKTYERVVYSDGTQEINEVK